VTDLSRHVPRVALVWDNEASGTLQQINDATVGFADISGSTALTQQLSRRGRIDAEELIGSSTATSAACCRGRPTGVVSRRGSAATPCQSSSGATITRRGRAGSPSTCTRRCAGPRGSPPRWQAQPVHVGRHRLGPGGTLPRWFRHAGAGHPGRRGGRQASVAQRPDRQQPLACLPRGEPVRRLNTGFAQQRSTGHGSAATHARS